MNLKWSLLEKYFLMEKLLNKYDTTKKKKRMNDPEFHDRKVVKGQGMALYQFPVPMFDFWVYHS